MNDVENPAYLSRLAIFLRNLWILVNLHPPLLQRNINIAIVQGRGEGGGGEC